MKELNEYRVKILQKGFANTKEIQKFIPCSYRTAKKIRTEIENKKTQPLQGVIATELLFYVGLTRKEIIEYATK